MNPACFARCPDCFSPQYFVRRPVVIFDKIEGTLQIHGHSTTLLRLHQSQQVILSGRRKQFEPIDRVQEQDLLSKIQHLWL